MFEQIFVNDGSEEMEHLAELIEFVHLLLFFSMIVYYIFLSLVGVVCVRHLRHLHEFETFECNKPYSKAKEIALLEASISKAFLGFHFFGRLEWEKYHFYRMKNVFLESLKNRPHFDTLPSADLTFTGFSYTDYLSSATTHLFTKMIHVGWRVWSALIVTLSVLTGLFCILMASDVSNPNGSSSLDFTTQLHRMWFPPSKSVTDNNFVVNFLNIFGFIFLIISRLIYVTVNNETFLSAISDLAFTPPSSPPSTEVTMNDLSSELLPPANKGKKKRPKATTLFDPFRRCGDKREWEDPYAAVWFMKAPDLMVRVYQSQVLFFSFYASAFILTLRFANDLAWVFFVLYPVIVLFGMGYKLLPHYASVRYVGSLALDSAIGAGGRGGTDSFASSSINEHH